MTKRADSASPEHQPGSAVSAHSDVPSWPTVIATTVRLWLRRRVGGGPQAGTPRRAGSRRRAGVFGLVIVVFAAGALTIALAQTEDNSTTVRADSKDSRASARHGRRPAAPVKLSTAALEAAARSRQEAAAWVAAQVSHAAIVSCDPVMCAALQSAGFPAGDLLTLGPSATDPMGSQVVVATTVLRYQFGSRLADVYAPAVIASFGTGTTRVDVRAEAADGAQAYLVAQRADLLAREQAGQQLLGNPGLHVTAAARQALAAGDVDTRLLVVLAALTAEKHNVYVYGFGDQGPGAAAGVPQRMVRIAALVEHSYPFRDPYLHGVLRFLGAQQATFRPSTAVLHLPGHKTEIQIEFPAPSPLGLLGAHASR
jgi:hypothetical protein